MQKKFKNKNKWKNAEITISKELRDIIHGYVMSNGYIRSNGILQVDHSRKQKKFVEWLYNKFKPIRTSSSIKEVNRVHPGTQTKTYSVRFYTKSLLNGFHYIWYRSFKDQKDIIKYKKKLPKNIQCFFNETFISVWFAGDGTKIIGSVGAKFEVTTFTVNERLKLKKLFLKKFNIKVKIIKSGISKKGNTQWALKVPAQEYPKFRELITKNDLIPTIFPYKLHRK